MKKHKIFLEDPEDDRRWVVETGLPLTPAEDGSAVPAVEDPIKWYEVAR